MSYAIHNTKGEHLGFLLLAGEGENGDCIFRSLPGKPELFDTEETGILYSFQEEGEFQWNLTQNGLDIVNKLTGSKATLSGEELSINGYTFKVVDMGAS